ncbi:MAG: hypothetical protein LBD85_04970, partial [Oscillospiraceae bacterium]|nr:hypothetical protein [Oscillospiraceae bacterium]
KAEWARLNAIGAVRSRVEQVKTGDVYSETRYYITSLTDVNRFANAVRSHWSIENRLENVYVFPRFPLLGHRAQKVNAFAVAYFTICLRLCAICVTIPLIQDFLRVVNGFCQTPFYLTTAVLYTFFPTVTHVL